MKLINKMIEKLLDINFFKMIFMISCFLYCIPLTNEIFSNIFKIFILWGAIVFIFNYFYNKKYTFKSTDYLMGIFLIIAFIGCLVNYKNNLITNVISVSYLFIQTILMLSYTKSKDFDTTIKKQKAIYNVITALTFLASIVSLLIFLLNIKISYASGFQQILYGVFEGRLYGIQGNPNSLGQFGLISIWMSVMIITINNYYNKKGNKWLMINIIIQFICLVLSNSRSSILGLAISLFIYCIFMLAFSYKKKETIFKIIFEKFLNISFKLVLISISVVCFGIFSKMVMLWGANSINKLNLDFDFNLKIENSTQVTDDNKLISKDEIAVDREYNNADSSNGRFELWSAGLKVFIQHPLFGVGTKNINEHANKYLSTNTITITPKLSENMHNIFIQVLVAHGIIAFIIFVGYIIINIYKIVIHLLKYKCNDNLKNELIFKLVLVNFVIISALLVINLFDSNILYFCSVFFTFVFWNGISNINELIEQKDDDKTNILFLVDSLDNGGIEKALIDLTNNIKNKDYNIHVKTIYNEGIYIKKLNKNISYSSIVNKPNIWKKRIFYRLVKYLPAKLLYQLYINEKYDIEIAYHELLSTKILSGSSSNSKKIAWIHTNIFAIKNNYQMFNSYKLFVKGYDKFDKIICVSNNIKNTFNEKTKLYQKTETIYNPIDTEKIIKLSKEKCKIKKTANKFLIISLGRLEKVKGYDKLCQAINKLQTKHNVELWILGEGSERKNLERYIKENNLEQSIKLLGFDENPYKYLVQADVFISTSEIEGFSLAVAEAIVLGLPVVSTKTDGPREILEDGKYGKLIDNNVESIISSLEEIIENNNAYKELKEQSNLCQQKFDLNDTINKFNKLVGHFTLKKDYDCFCTVFTPTYNRAYILDKLYESLKKQTFKDFEWVIVDDGSEDNTKELVETWQAKKEFNIKYLKVSNGGKQKAINRGLEYAKGKMFFIVDSDDFLVDDAIEKVYNYEKTIAKDNCFAGIAGLHSYTNNEITGNYNKKEYVDCTNLERDKFNLLGDKAEVYYTDLLQKYKFPEIINEKFVTECVVWDEIAFNGYKIRWFNDVLKKGDYLEDGYTTKANSLYLNNSIGYLIYIRNQVKYYPFDIKRKIGNYYRYYKVTKDKKSINEISNDLLICKITLSLIITVNKFLKK